MSRLSARELRARLEVAERAIGVGGVGLLVVKAVIAAVSVEGQDRVIGIEVHDGEGWVMYERRPGETVEALHARANPFGGLRLRARPVFG